MPFCDGPRTSARQKYTVTAFPKPHHQKLAQTTAKGSPKKAFGPGILIDNVMSTKKGGLRSGEPITHQ
ncbi:MAG: hypothetical protein DI617_07850 [Streptococcus pyogenes]|nr:MAG: hypothetical protein DI617_07850 [Streptococcus pyogenes]